MCELFVSYLWVKQIHFTLFKNITVQVITSNCTHYTQHKQTKQQPQLVSQRQQATITTPDYHNQKHFDVSILWPKLDHTLQEENRKDRRLDCLLDYDCEMKRVRIRKWKLLLFSEELDIIGRKYFTQQKKRQYRRNSGGAEKIGESFERDGSRVVFSNNQDSFPLPSLLTFHKCII